MPVSLLLVILAALVIRCSHLGRLPLSYDEHFFVYAAIQPASLKELFSLLRDNPTHLMLEPLLNFLTGRLTSDIFFLRLPAALLGTATVWLTFILGARVFNRRVGLIGAGLLAVSMLHVEYSRQLNFYGALGFLTLLSALSVMRLVETGGKRALAWCWLAHVLLLHTHLYAPLVMALEGLWVLAFYRDKFPKLGACFAFAGLCYLPCYLAIIKPMLGKQAFQATPFAEVVRGTLECWGQVAEQTSRAWSRKDRLIQGVGGIAVYAGLYLYGLFRLARQRAWSPGRVLVACWLPLAWLAVVAADYKMSHFFAPRQTLFFLPFFLLVVAYGIEGCLERRRAVGVVAAAAVLILFGRANVLDLRTWNELGKFRKELARAVAMNVKEEDILVFENPHAAQSFLYDYDFAAFLRALPPRIYNGFYSFAFSSDFQASNGRVSSRILFVRNPLAFPGKDDAWARIGGEGRPMPRLLRVPARSDIGGP